VSFSRKPVIVKMVHMKSHIHFILKINLQHPSSCPLDGRQEPGSCVRPTTSGDGRPSGGLTHRRTVSWHVGAIAQLARRVLGVGRALPAGLSTSRPSSRGFVRKFIIYKFSLNISYFLKLKLKFYKKIISKIILKIIL
jgi:hypothetical protein